MKQILNSIKKDQILIHSMTDKNDKDRILSKVFNIIIHLKQVGLQIEHWSFDAQCHKFILYYILTVSVT